MSALYESMARSSFQSHRADFFMDLASALEDKSDLVSEIANLHRRAEERGQKGKMMLYGRWMRGLDSGVLTEAIKDDIPKTDLMILSAFETAGRLPEGLRFLSKTVLLSAKMKSTIQVAVSGPIIVLCMIGGILALHAYMLTPVLEQIYPVEHWPLPGRILYPVAMFVRNYGLYLAAFIVMLLIAFKISIAKWSGAFRGKLDEFIPYSIFRDYNGALFLTSLAALMKAGSGVMESLNQLKSMSTPWMQWHIKLMLTRMDMSASEPAKALDTGCLPREVMDRIIDYGRRSSFLDAMNMIGLQSMERTEEKIKKSASTLNMVMLLLVGALFGIVILGTVMTGLNAQDYIRANMNM
jgi:type II secretory pathway component PulF